MSRSWMELAWNDIRHGWRGIRRMPVLAAVVVSSLAVGIGVNTAVFSWVEAVLLRPLPGVPRSASFFLVEPRSETGSYPGVSWAEYRDVAERVPSLPDLLAFRIVPFNVGERGRVERTFGLLVSGNYFAALGIRPAIGRFIRPDEVARAGAEPVVVVSYSFWQTRLGRDVSPVGRTIRVNDRLLTVVGVAPERFQGTVLGLNFDLWVPATLAPVLLAESRELEDRSLRGYDVMGRLGPDATREQAQAEVNNAMTNLARAYPETNARLRAEVLPFSQAPRGPQRLLARALVILQSVMVLLLLAVCGNTANLLLARASTRHREVGIRLALGAGPGRILNFLLTESLTLALVGAAGGVAIAIWGTSALRAVPLIGGFPIKFQTSIDGVGLGFAALLGIACGLIFGVAPAVQLARTDAHTSIRVGAGHAGGSVLRSMLMGVQVGLALAVLMAAALFLRSFRDARELDPGFRREGVLLAAYDLTGRNLSASAVQDFTRRLLRRVQSLPSVESAAIAVSVPLDIHGLPLRSFTLEGHRRSEVEPDQALANTVTAGYFRTMGIPLRAGTDFTALDDATTVPQAIVNDEFVRRYLQGDEPLGRRLESRGRAYTITGVVANSTSESFGEPPTPVMYFSYRDRPAPTGEIHLRTRAGSEALLAPQVERVVRELDPTLPVYNVRTLSDHIERNLFLRRIPARMFVVLGPLLLVLAAIGIYAVVAYAVSVRRVEIGIRLALGATTRRVVSEIVADSMRVISIGALIGWLISLAISLHLVRGPLYLSVFAGVPLVLLLVGSAACWVPARRAATVDPMTVLRDE